MSVFLVAFLTPTGRFLIWLNGALRAGEAVNVEVPVAALKLWFIITPLVAFGPPAVVIIAWWRGRVKRNASGAGFSR